MAKSTLVLVAACTLVGAKLKDSDEPEVLEPGEELTPAIQKKFGLKKADVEDLLERGSLVEVNARSAEGSGDDKAVKAAEARADAAEEKVAELEKANADLEKQLEEATKPAEK